MKTKHVLGYAPVGWAALMFATACGAGAPAENAGDLATVDDSSKLFAEPLAAELGVGSRGVEVRAVYEALRQHGYFPNAELQESYPAWRPLVAEAPPAPEVFDEHLAAAVAAFQRNSGLSETGSVDSATWTRLGAQNCGVPEGIPRPDGSEKYDFGNGKWDKPVVVWRVNNVTGSKLSMADVVFQVGRAFGKWSKPSGLSFRQASAPGSIPPDPPDIEIGFGRQDGNVAGAASYPDDGGNDKGGDITLDNTNRIWSFQDLPGTGETDLISVLVHEIGHAIGIAHTTNGSSVMRGDSSDLLGRSFRELGYDDMTAARVLYGSWVHDSDIANAQDVATGGDGSDADSNPEVWAVGGTPVAGGYRVYRKDPNGWQEATGRGAIAIGVDSVGRPWIVQDNGSIYRYSASIVGGTATWGNPINGCAIDIGVSGRATSGGSVWVIGCDGFIYRWNGSLTASNPWATGIPGGISRIAVDEFGNPWVVAEDHTIWRADSLLRWEQMPGNPVGTPFTPAFGIDVGVGPKNFAYVVGDELAPYTWDQQAPGAPGTAGPPALERYDWIGIGGGMHRIAVGPTGTVWGVGLDNQTWHFGPL